jgi:hypothetical protein
MLQSKWQPWSKQDVSHLPGLTHDSPADITACIEERRRNFPTRSRVESKKSEAKSQIVFIKKEPEDKNSQLEKQQQKAEKIRKQLEKVESSIKRKREQQDEGDDMRNVEMSSSASSDGLGSDDDKLEAMLIRPEPGHIPPPAKKADPTKHCKYYSTAQNLQATLSQQMDQNSQIGQNQLVPSQQPIESPNSHGSGQSGHLGPMDVIYPNPSPIGSVHPIHTIMEQLPLGLSYRSAETATLPPEAHRCSTCGKCFTKSSYLTRHGKPKATDWCGAAADRPRL